MPSKQIANFNNVISNVYLLHARSQWPKYANQKDIKSISMYTYTRVCEENCCLCLRLNKLFFCFCAQI